MGDDIVDRDELERRARRRKLVWLVIMAVVVPTLSVLLDSTIIRPTHPHHRTHDSTYVGVAAAVIIVAALGIIGVGIVARRKFGRQRRGILAVPLVVGLPRDQRRSVRTNVTRGIPSSDPSQAEIERDLATSRLRGFRSGILGIGVFVVLGVVMAVISHGTSARVFYTCAAVLFAVILVKSVREAAGARKYLQASAKS